MLRAADLRELPCNQHTEMDERGKSAIARPELGQRNRDECGWPRTVPVCYLTVINRAPFPSQKCPGLDDNPRPKLQLPLAKPLFPLRQWGTTPSLCVGGSMLM